MLHDSCNTLKTHAGIDVTMRKLRQRAIFLTVKLSENKVPELKVAVTIISRRFSLKLRALIKVNLRARTTRTSWTSCPEVVLLTQTGNVIFCYAKRPPNLNCLIVISKNGKVQAIKWQTKVLWRRNKLHCPGTCIALGITTKREVTQHLKERKVTGVANVVNIVSTKTLLAGCSANLLHSLNTLVILLKLIHASVSKEQ